MGVPLHGCLTPVVMVESVAGGHDRVRAKGVVAEPGRAAATLTSVSCEVFHEVNIHVASQKGPSDHVGQADQRVIRSYHRSGLPHGGHK